MDPLQIFYYGVVPLVGVVVLLLVVAALAQISPQMAALLPLMLGLAYRSDISADCAPTPAAEPAAVRRVAPETPQDSPLELSPRPRPGDLPAGEVTRVS